MKPRARTSRSTMTTRARKQRPGRITFVGSGPGDPGLLTTRARDGARECRPDLHRPRRTRGGAGPGRLRAAAAVGARAGRPAHRRPTRTADGGRPTTSAVVTADPISGPRSAIRPRSPRRWSPRPAPGTDVVRLVAGDPLSVDSVITEVNAVTRTHLPFEIVPGLPASTAVPTYAGLPLGSSHTEADVRGDVDWAALAAAPGPADPAGHRVAPGRRGPHADRVRTGRHHPVCRHRAGHHVPAAVGGDHAGRAHRHEAAIGPTSRRAR